MFEWNEIEDFCNYELMSFLFFKFCYYFLYFLSNSALAIIEQYVSFGNF